MSEESRPRHLIAPLNRGGALTDVAQFSFAAEQRRELLGILGYSAIDPRLNAFVPALEDAIGTFITMRELEGQQLSNAEVRQTLHRLAKDIAELRPRVELLDPQSLRSLDIGVQAANMADPSYRGPVAPMFVLSVTAPVGEETLKELDRLKDSLDILAHALERAEEMARQDKGGRPVAGARILLGRAIARTFAAHLGSRATSTVSGKFEEVLRLALIAGGDNIGEYQDLHSLVLKALEGTKPPPESP